MKVSSLKSNWNIYKETLIWPLLEHNAININERFFSHLKIFLKK